MKKRRILLITTPSLFGNGATRLLESQKNRFEIRRVPSVASALTVSAEFLPEVIVYLCDKSDPANTARLQQFVSQHPARVIQCTLEANQLTIFDHITVQNATVEDLLSAVLR